MNPQDRGVRALRAVELPSPRDVAAELVRVCRLVPDERAARMVWARLVEPENKEAIATVAKGGARAALEELKPEEDIARNAFPRLLDIYPAREQSILRALGARVLIPGDDEWPVAVEDHPEPPLCLWVRGSGDLVDLTERSVAIVGARAATAYGVHTARELGAGVADREFTVVSGAAYGIDAAAHEGALAVEGTTVAVLAGGIDRAYPASHAGLLERVAATGAVVTEVAPGSAPTRWRFLSRNRIIAAVSGATVVVEAGLRSGSRNTAKHARGMGRPIAAVPGPVTSAVSAGCHELIRGGATLVTDAAEVVELAGRIGELAPLKQEQATLVDELDPVQRRVFEAMPTRAPADLEALVRRSGMSGRQVRAALAQLEVSGLSERRPGGWRKAGEERKGVAGQI